jgi:hypothetical protein
MTDDQIRQALTSVLNRNGWDSDTQDRVDALLPVIRHAQATALRDAANDPELTLMNGRRWLHDRADTLDPQP